MMRSRQIVRMALAGMAVVACGPKGNEYQASAPPTTQAPVREGVTAAASPSPLTPLRQVKPVKVTIRPTCDHVVDRRNEKLIAANRDALDWQIRNNCASRQKVLICSYRDGQLFNPLEPCVSTPTGGLDIGTAFTVDPHKSESLECTAKPHPRRQAYQQVILVGNEVPSSGCPGAPPVPHPEVILTHELGVEIFP
jgi:hypothetical protein